MTSSVSFKIPYGRYLDANIFVDHFNSYGILCVAGWNPKDTRELVLTYPSEYDELVTLAMLALNV